MPVSRPVVVPGRSPRGERGLKFHQPGGILLGVQSLPSRGARVEILLTAQDTALDGSRSPRGERGLKYFFCRLTPCVKARRSPRGERGLKLALHPTFVHYGCRSPRGERGLKLPHRPSASGSPVSLPSRGARVEIICCHRTSSRLQVAPLAGSEG